PSSCTFYHWNAVGHKFAAIARGSSIYALVIIVSLNLRWTMSKLVEQVPWEIRKMLRNLETSTVFLFLFHRSI
ncbi:hypothetical protein DFJ58DRAFT_668552, partial [Suillus subalutaceus]|uniref:uncharacterized protein n=1 Tax=Suillus subalutaceus TaxID=48586 RepID=UPI001B8769D2